MTNLKIRFCVDFGELNHFYTHRINSVTLRVKENLMTLQTSISYADYSIT